MAILGATDKGSTAATVAAAKAAAARKAAAVANAMKPPSAPGATNVGSGGANSRPTAAKTTAPPKPKTTKTTTAPKTTTTTTTTNTTAPKTTTNTNNGIPPGYQATGPRPERPTTEDLEKETEVAYPDATSDPMYQLQLAQLANSLSNFRSNQQLALTQYDDQLDENLRRMGWSTAMGGWDPRGQGSYGQDYRNNEGDFAARGAYYSGPRVTAESDLNFGYDSQKTDMDNARARYVRSQKQALSQLQRQNELARQEALTQSVMRIAAQQGIDFNKVPGADQLTSI